MSPLDVTLQQAVGVILGANVGTTFTAQLIAFKLTKAALPAITIGVGMKFFSKKMKYRYIGEVILGGLLTSTFLNMVLVPILFAKWGGGTTRRRGETERLV